MEINEDGDKIRPAPQHCTYVAVPQEGTCTACMYAIVPPGSWSLDLFANEPQSKTLEHVVSAEPLHGSEFMKFKVFPRITPDFSLMSLSPPHNIEEWILPEIVTESEYPKCIKVPFIQMHKEVQLFCSVQHNSQKVQSQDIAKLEMHTENEHVIRILAIIVSEKGEWTFTLTGRHLQEYQSKASGLLQYTVKGT